MCRSHSIHVCLAFVISVVVLPTLAAQTLPGNKTSASSHTHQIAPDKSQFVRCLEELDLAACKHARQQPLNPRETSLVLTYEFMAQPPGAPTTTLDQAVALDPQNGLAYFVRGMVSTDYEEGLKSYLKAIELNPEWKRYYVDAALLGDNTPSYKSSEKGLDLWQVAVESAPDDPRVYAGYGSALKSRGRIAEAEAMFQRGLAANPKDVQSASALCSLYIEQKNLAKLRPVCRRAIELTSSALENLAYQLNDVKEHELAEAAYRKALEKRSDPQHTAELNLAYTLILESKLPEAGEIYTTYLARHPDDSTIRDAYASVLEAMGNIEEAGKQYLKAVDTHGYCGTHAALGRFYLRQKRYDDTFEQLDKSFQGQFDCPESVYILTHDAAQFGSEQARVPTFSKAMLTRARPNVDEKSANTWYRFANFAHEIKQNDQAIEAYRKAADLDPKQAFPLGGLGRALYDAGRYQEAIAAFEEAEKRQPGYLKSAPEVQKRYEQSLAASKGRKN